MRCADVLVPVPAVPAVPDRRLIGRIGHSSRYQRGTRPPDLDDRLPKPTGPRRCGIDRLCPRLIGEKTQRQVGLASHRHDPPRSAVGRATSRSWGETSRVRGPLWWLSGHRGETNLTGEDEFTRDGNNPEGMPIGGTHEGKDNAVQILHQPWRRV